MSGQNLSIRLASQKSSRKAQSEGNENEFGNLVIPFPPRRTPFNTIQDPLVSPRVSSKYGQHFESKAEGLSLGVQLPEYKGIGNGGSNYATPRGAGAKSHSEPNSTQSTPARTVSRVSNVGSSGTNALSRPNQQINQRGGSFSKVCRGISNATSWFSVDVPHFELEEDSSFWMDHNVQVLIRIRPVSNIEKTSQGCARCLRQETAQSLTWLGHPETRLTFDHIACETITQEKLFNVAGVPMVENCMSGYNSCMFAYGQTGSGKTYTMMGEIYELDDQFSSNCGMTPRIFQYLFRRIKLEEENRRDENLKFSCKCSFLEIYNEQITDLLEPSSTNLQLREDMKKGVYVENLKEFEVTTVKDVIELLVQGAANRKMAATHMNSESSRSHSVFTCVIESQWEKDSMTHFRFGRLNLVDLAGSERQKSSGADGERLKEAANINKSLSTLGLVIMSLVDVAHGKHRHIPYRDSRLTFLLQDSLGGNSKTTIIANISPSMCSANETLSTLKFAQRAKLIQNNAKVNEGASGDVIELQQQIQQLKDQLHFVLGHQKTMRPPSLSAPHPDESNDFHEDHSFPDVCNYPSAIINKTKYLEAILVGALRREKIAETALNRLGAEIEHMNRLVHQREEDAQRTKMMQRFREEKIKRLELLAEGFLPADEYLMEENNALSEEIQLLQERFDKNPELTQFALQNLRLLEQLRMFQNFYEQGEREILLAEVSTLRDQLLEVLKGNFEQSKFPSEYADQAEEKDHTMPSNVQVKKPPNIEVEVSFEEFEDCRKKLDNCLAANAKLTREVDELRSQLKQYTSSSGTHCAVEDTLSREVETVKRSIIDHNIQQKDPNKTQFKLSQIDVISEVEVETAKTRLCLQEELAKLEQEGDSRDASESEATGPSLLLGIENQDLKKRLCIVTSENIRLSKAMSARDDEIRALNEEWEAAVLDLTSFLLDGCRSLQDASDQIGGIVDSFSQKKASIGEQVEATVRSFIESEKIITYLQKRLEDAQTLGVEMEVKLSSLKGATLAITEGQQQANNESVKEVTQLRTLLSEKTSEIQVLENKLRFKEDRIIKAEKCASAALIAMKRLHEMNVVQPLHAKVVESLIDTAEGGCCKIGEMSLSNARSVAEEKMKQANHLLLKFEEAQETMKEADLMLNELLRINENTKHEANGWKQAGEDLMRERVVLVEEVEQLRAFILLKEEQYKLLQDQTSASLIEIVDSISSLEFFFQKIQNYVDEELKVIYSDISLFEWELRDYVGTTRSFLEDIWSKIMEKSLVSFVLYHTHIGIVSEKLLCLNADSGSVASKQHAGPFTGLNPPNYGRTDPLRERQVSFEKNPISGEEKQAPAPDIRSTEETISKQGLYLNRSSQELVSFKVLSGIILEQPMPEEGLVSPDTSHSRISKELDLLSYKIQNHISADREIGVTDAFSENMTLKKELDRKAFLLQGLLFDIRLLQESTSNVRDIKNEAALVMTSFSQVRHELAMKTTQVDAILVQYRELEARLADREAAIFSLKSELNLANENLRIHSSENSELRFLLKDLYVQKTNTDEQLEEKKKVVEGLEREILRMAISIDGNILSSMEEIENELGRVRDERDQLREEVISLNDRLEVSNALADENEAIAVEARQLSEASKIYAEQKEEEVKILEHSVEELECTVNVLEQKVYDMREEVERHHLIREELELELQTVRRNLSPVREVSEKLDIKNLGGRELTEHQILRKIDHKIVDLYEARRHIVVLEMEKEEQAKEIKKCREYMSELVLHSEAQSAQYQEKYKTLEAMIREVKADPLASNVAASTVNKTERSSMRPRGSGSPFKCIAGLVQQMNSERDQELSVARFRVEELEAIAASLRKEVCMLRARLATTESMTHDVIRDLLGVKLDITNYANLVDQRQIQKLAEKAQQQLVESISKDQEILELRKQIKDSNEEKKRWIEEINQKEEHIQVLQFKVEQLQQRNQLFAARNEMLKREKINLKREMGDLDEMVKNLLQHENTQHCIHQPKTSEENATLGVGKEEFIERIAHSKNLLARVNNELAQFRKSNDRNPSFGVS